MIATICLSAVRRVGRGAWLNSPRQRRDTNTRQILKRLDVQYENVEMIGCRDQSLAFHATQGAANMDCRQSHEITKTLLGERDGKAADPVVVHRAAPDGQF